MNFIGALRTIHFTFFQRLNQLKLFIYRLPILHFLTQISVFKKGRYQDVHQVKSIKGFTYSKQRYLQNFWRREFIETMTICVLQTSIHHINAL